MTLPTFSRMRFRRSQSPGEKPSPTPLSDASVTNEQSTSSPSLKFVGVVDMKRATSTRRHAIWIASFSFVVSVVFLILVLIGNLHNKPVLRDTWFLKLDLSNIIPNSVPNAVLINSIAQSIGLHDFYQVGLWNFCEGYNGQGITDCSDPTNMYWFNPVAILLNELLAGASITLPADINNILRLIKLASNVMFAFFIAGTVFNFVSIFITWVVVYTRWWSLALAIFTFIGALLTTAATIVATVMFVIFKNTITSQSDVNIGATLGTQMFAFMWVATAFSLLGFVIHLCLMCCCASRRDIRTGRKRGNSKAYSLQQTSDDAREP